MKPILLALTLAVLAGCSSDTTAPQVTEPQHVEVQHVLVGFQGTVPGKAIPRTQAEAEVLAAVVLARARAGEDFSGLVQQYTDDQFPGIYRLANRGTPAAGQEYARAGMVKGFADLCFALPVGGVGLVAFDAQDSPYGYHVIKRLK